jgi:hypothetical protein
VSTNPIQSPPEYDPPSRRVTSESLRHWANKDLLAYQALRGGFTEAELIHALLQDRSALMEMLAASKHDRLVGRIQDIM